MRAVRSLTWTEIKLFLREPSAVFFSLALPVLLLVVFGGIDGGSSPAGEFAASTVPGYASMILATTALMYLPVVVSAYRDQGILRRLSATPISAGTVLSSQVLSLGALAAVGIVLLLAVAMAFFGLPMPADPVATLAAFALGGLGMMGLGFVIAALSPTARTAEAVASAVYFPMLFLSGAVVSRGVMPPWMHRVGDGLPLTWLVTGVQGAWTDGRWDPAALGALLAAAVVGAVVASRAFRWR
jgi:ABC-2 type transport system permease protein